MALRCFGSVLGVRWASTSTPRIAVVGSGPAGLFVCGALLRRLPSCSVDVFDASPVPFGLIRYGVAPDHQEVKNCIHGFEKMFNSNADRIHLYCNVKIGTDITIDELRDNYSGIVLSYGSRKPRKLRVPGEDARNVWSGSSFVGWYNGDPSVSSSPLLDSPHVLIIGNGNVSLDCARILSLGVDSLCNTDVPDHVLFALRNSKVNDIKVIGRRGPQDVSFTIKEFREQLKVKDWTTNIIVSVNDREYLEKNMETADRRRKRLLKVIYDNLGTRSGDRRCSFLFRRSPKEIKRDSSGRVSSVLFSTENGVEELECGLLIASLGYESVVLPGLPSTPQGSLSMVDPVRVSLPSVYAVGWCAAPRGVIADSQQNSAVAADVICRDVPQMKEGKGVRDLLEQRKVPYIGWEQWKKIDEVEKKNGAEKGKVREKLMSFNEYSKH